MIQKESTGITVNRMLKYCGVVLLLRREPPRQSIKKRWTATPLSKGGELLNMPYKRSRSDIHTLPHLAKIRTKLRKRLTPAEAAFWNLVKESRLDGRKFRRQHSVGSYVVDFYCPSEKLAVELDGEVHFVDRPGLNDRSRRLFIESKGIRVIRFENKKIFEETEWVLDVIRSNFGWSNEKA